MFSFFADWLSGAKKTKVYKVKTPKDLEKAVKKTKKRHIIAYLQNDIVFEDEAPILEILKNGLTLYGPGTIRGASFYSKKAKGPIEFNNVRIRVGAKNLGKNDKRDAFYADKCPYVKFTNCTFSDSSDEVLSFDEVEELIIHRCIIGDPLHIPTVDNKGKQFIHDEGKKGSHGFGMRSGTVKNMSVTETLFANCNCRSPQLNNENMDKDTYTCLVENCVMYNYGEHAFKFNIQDNHEVKGGDYQITLRHNTFIPGPRTKKVKDDGDQETTIEIDSKTPTKIKAEYHDLETNKIMYYPEFYVEEGGRKYYLHNGAGLQIPMLHFLENVGAINLEEQDGELKTIVLAASEMTEHHYDGYDDEPDKWPKSHWKHWSE